MECFCAEAGCGRYQISAMAVVCGRDLSILLCGGTRHHVGAVALGTPPGEVRTMSLPSHRDDVVAEKAAKRFARAFCCNVSVTVGVHIDSAAPAEVQILVENCRACCAALEEKLSPHFSPASGQNV